MKRAGSVRRGGLVIAMAAFCVVFPASLARAQSSTPPASQQDNPFPGEPANSQAAQQGAKPEQKPAGGKESENPFPGEDTAVPIIPVAPGSASGSGTPGTAKAAEETEGAAADSDGDPVRSPDGRAKTADDGFSSSRAGLGQIPAEDTGVPGRNKSLKVKTREQVIKEDVDVGGFYLSVKNWKAAQMRFSSAFAMDAENADAVWGLAEAERHLDLFADAEKHYRLFLSYDPDGPHSKEARKSLEGLEAAHPSAVTAAGPGGGMAAPK